MYAIVEIAGQQFKVEEGRKIYVHKLEANYGERIDFEKVLLIADDDKVIIGEPVIKNAVVEGLVIEHLKGDKVIVFKKKRKKGYRVKNGHRQVFTQLEILNILTDKGARRKDPVRKEKPAEPETIVAGTQEEVVEVKEPEKKAAARKTAPRKPAAKKEPKAESPEKSAETKSTSKKSAEKKPAEKKSTGKKKE